MNDYEDCVICGQCAGSLEASPDGPKIPAHQDRWSEDCPASGKTPEEALTILALINCTHHWHEPKTPLRLRTPRGWRQARCCKCRVRALVRVKRGKKTCGTEGPRIHRVKEAKPMYERGPR